MAEEPTPTPEVQDTSPPVPETDTQEPVVNYQARYESLRPEFDRKSQQLAEYEERLAAYEAQLAQEPEDDDAYEYDYEDSVARQRLEQLEAHLAQREQEETLERQYTETVSFIDNELESIEKQFDEELSDSESSWIGNYALANTDEEGRPDVRRAYEAFNEMLEGRKQKWTKTKRTPKVNTGPAAAQSIDLDDPKTRREYMAQKLQELEGQD